MRRRHEPSASHPRVAGRARRLRRGGALLVVLLALTACGSGDDDAGGDTDGTAGTATDGDAGGDTDGGEEQATVDPDGVLRYARSLTGIPVTMDPVQANSPQDFLHEHLIFDTLIHLQTDGSWEPGLATDAQIVDSSTIELDLREGVTFTDGTPFDAEAVEFNLERNKAAENRRSFRAELQAIDEIEVTGDHSLTIHLAEPVAGAFFPLLGAIETLVVSPTAVQDESIDVNQTPVGAGPFTLERFVQEQVIELRKNPDYWDADNIRLAGVDFVHVDQGPSTVNALRAGQVDVVQATAQVTSGFDAPNIETEVQPSDNSFLWFQVCKSEAPFDDVRVRQALNYALDRDAIDQAIYDGRAEPQWGFWTQSSPFFNPELEGFYEHDVEQAQQLLADAGHEDLSFDVMLTGAPTGDRLAEIAQEQWNQAGMDVNLVQATNIVQEFFIDVQAPMAAITLNRMGLDKITRTLAPGSVGNVCNYDDEEWLSIIDELRAVPQQSDEAVDLWHEVQTFAFENALNIFGVMVPQANAWDTERIGGVEFVPDVFGNRVVDFRNAFVKQ